MERPGMRTLERGPETLHSVRVRLVPDVLGDRVLHGFMGIRQSFVGRRLVAVDGGIRRGRARSQSPEAWPWWCQSPPVRRRDFVARSFAPTTAVLPTAPRPVSASSLRRAFDMLRRFPPMYVSSTSTGPS